MKRTNKKGFTIVELVIVIAVIAILAAVLIPNISRLVKKANESSDIQAVRNMNTFLAAENVTGGVDSILDVYDLFKESGYNVDSYTPLYSGRHFYYDKQYNQILYVDTKSGKVLYPEEHKNELQADHDWFSLSMEAPEAKEPTGYTTTADTITASVSSPEEYAFVIQEYNKGKAKNLTLTLQGNLDLMGANCVIKKVEADATVKIASAAGKTFVIKNVTANTEVEQGNIRNAERVPADYYAAGLISVCEGAVVIENVTFENINVKVPTAGQIGVLIGVVQGGNGKLTVDNVTVKNCSVIGHRDVGAIAGAAQNGGIITLKNNITIENTKVKTTGGRSALIVGKLNDKSEINVETLTLKTNGSKMSIYEDTALEQKFANTADGWTVKTRVEIEGQNQYIYSLKSTSGEKKYVAYGYRADALVVIEVKDSAWKAITDLSSFITTGAKAN